MAKNNVATHHDAELILRLYDLRREERMRAAREWFIQKFSPQTLDDVKALAGTENASYRMVTTYWDMAASFITHGILDADLYFESGGEMLVVWAKMEHLVPEIRREIAPRFLWNVEKAGQASELAKARLVALRARFAPKK